MKMRDEVSLFQKISFVFILSLSFLCTHCFLLGGGVKNPGRVRGYEPGRVITEKSSYGVGLLPSEWVKIKIGKYKTAAFYNEAYKSTIETDAFCGQSYDDATLKVLTTHLYFDLQKQKIRWQKNFMLDERGALRSVTDGTVDGVPIVLDTVIIKKDSCLFDLALISDPGLYSKAAVDFEAFFKGFRYQGEP